MVDLTTLRRVNVAVERAADQEALAPMPDGRLLIANSHQIDVLAPIIAPMVVHVNPPDEAIVQLPLGSVSVTFDQDMAAVEASRPESVINPANYRLALDGGNQVVIKEVRYDVAARTATLIYEPLAGGLYSLTVEPTVRSRVGLAMTEHYVTQFIAVEDFSTFVRLDFERTRSDRLDGTLSYDLRVTNISDFDLLTPLKLILDPARYFQGLPAGSFDTSADGLWLIDLGGSVTNGRLQPGQSTVTQTITFSNPGEQRASVGHGIYALPYPNTAPVFDTPPLTQAALGRSTATKPTRPIRTVSRSRSCCWTDRRGWHSIRRRDCSCGHRPRAFPRK